MSARAALAALLAGGHDGLWWTAAEIAQARLPQTPDSLRGVRALADREGWAVQGSEKARLRRGARGGAWEYHRDLLPPRARTAILAALAPQADAPAGDRIAAWALWDAAPQTRRDRAMARVKAVADSDALKATGLPLAKAVAAAAAVAGAAPGSLWRWRALVKDARRDDWPAVLLPRHGRAPDAGAASARRAGVAEADWEYFVSDYLRPERPALAACFRRAARIAAAEGRALPCERSLRRRLAREVPRALQVMAREGGDAVKRLYPAQERDKRALHALEAVNADGHKFDVFVRWRDGHVSRPVMVALHDIHSGMFLSWRLHRGESRIGVLLALGDMVEDWGIPDHVLFDNGRAFAAKDITGGVPNRYRFKVRADDPLGVLPILGCTVHWATPYAGQSKPIERAFATCARTSRAGRAAPGPIPATGPTPSRRTMAPAPSPSTISSRSSPTASPSTTRAPGGAARWRAGAAFWRCSPRATPPRRSGAPPRRSGGCGCWGSRGCAPTAPAARYRSRATATGARRRTPGRGKRCRRASTPRICTAACTSTPPTAAIWAMRRASRRPGSSTPTPPCRTRAPASSTCAASARAWRR